MAGEKSTVGWDWGIGSERGLASSLGVSGALDMGLSRWDIAMRFLKGMRLRDALFS